MLFVRNLTLRAEPRLSGFVIAHDPRNPRPWRGRWFALDLLGKYGPNTPNYALLDERGEQLKDGDRAVRIAFPDTVSQRVLGKVRQRAFRRSVSDGTLSMVVAGRARSRLDRLMPVAALAIGTLAIGGMIGQFLWTGYYSHHPAHRDTTDLLIAVIVPFAMFGPVLFLAVLVAWPRRLSCVSYRLTADSLTPQDGPYSGRAFARGAVRLKPAVIRNFTRLIAEGVELTVSSPPLPISAWILDRQSIRQERRNELRRAAVIGGVGIALAIVAAWLVAPAGTLFQNQPGQIHPGLAAAMAVCMLGLLIWAATRAERWDRAMERRRRKRSREKAVAST
jgi:hypothetical protein